MADDEREPQIDPLSGAVVATPPPPPNVPPPNRPYVSETGGEPTPLSAELGAPPTPPPPSADPYKPMTRTGARSWTGTSIRRGK